MSRLRGRARPIAPLTVVATALLALTACGSADGSLSQARDYAGRAGAAIAADARTAMAGLSSVHVVGQLSQGSTSITLDLSVSDQDECTGMIGVDDASIEIRRTSDGAWYRADDSFWRQQAPAQAARIERKVGDRWVPLTGSLSTLSDFCSISRLTGQVGAGTGTVRSAGAAMVGAEPSARLVVRRDGRVSVAYVRAAPPHYLLRIRQGERADLVFSRFDTPFTVVAPAPGNVVELDTP